MCVWLSFFSSHTHTHHTTPTTHHSKHRVYIKKVLKPGENELTFVIRSAIKEANARNASSPYAIPAIMEAQVAQFNWLRKPASDFGWDWGPAFAPQGIYGEVSIVGYSDAHLVGANVRQTWAADRKSVTLTFDAVLQASKRGEEGVLTVVPASAGANPKWAATGAVVTERAGTNVVSLDVKLSKPFDIWWPVGYGAQPLYKFDVVYEPVGAPTSTTALSRKIGLRTIDLVRKPIPSSAFGGGEPGETMYFKVNGVPIYAKGTNMIPDDIFASRTTPANLRSLVNASVDANMNMIRVWGGGLYPLDDFYDACDEKGRRGERVGWFVCGAIKPSFFCGTPTHPTHTLQVSSSGKSSWPPAPCTPATTPSWRRCARR